jgi:hypothetical protein
MDATTPNATETDTQDFERFICAPQLLPLPEHR